MEYRINKTSSDKTFTLTKNGLARNLPAMFKASNDKNLITIKMDGGISESLNLDSDTLFIEGIQQSAAADAVIALNDIVGAGFKAGGGTSTPTPTLQQVTDAGASTGNSISIGEPAGDGDAATKGYVDGQIEAIASNALTFKGYISGTEPDSDLREGNLWRQSALAAGEAPDTTFPWSVKTFTGGAWSTETTDYTPLAMDMWYDTDNDETWYYVGNSWERLDFNGSAFNNAQFTVTNGVVSLKAGGITNNEISDNAQIVQRKVAGLPAALANIVNADWNATSGLAQILNKPSTLPPSYLSLPWDSAFNAQGPIFNVSGVNAPDGNSSVLGLSFSDAVNGHGIQIAENYSSGDVYSRSRASSSIKGWNKMWHSGNLPYEEGTWTPVIEGRATAGVANYQTQFGKYLRIGNLVHLDFTLIGTFTTPPSGQPEITGIPFAPLNGEYRTDSNVISFSIYDCVRMTIFPNSLTIIFNKSGRALSTPSSEMIFGTDLSNTNFNMRLKLSYNIKG